MNYYKNGDLFDFIRQKYIDKTFNAMEEALKLSRIVNELEKNKVVHLDIKFENIIVGDDENYLLCDFDTMRPVVDDQNY